MNIYAFMNCSGSAGKTTSAVAGATILAHEGYRVRVIDADPQANASRQLGYPQPEGPTITEVLMGTASIAEAERPARIPAAINDDGLPEFEDSDDLIIDNVTIVPADGASLEVFRMGAGSRGFGRLRTAVKEASDVDVTLIDGPGGFDAMTIQAILATQAFPHREDRSGVIAVTFPGAKEVEGILQVNGRLSEINTDFNVNAQLRGIIICNVKRNTPQLEQLYVDDVKGRFGDLVAPLVYYNGAVPQAYHHYMPVTLYASTADLRRITDEYREVFMEHFMKTGMFTEAPGARASL
ncbi:ParA family protein [Mycobacteroides abscessus]|uniref:ParA family protein n=1 Tax=Mycobacteroides abscessus TaxID=36809 RepID=A0ABD7HLV6_9MYCO|nr:ParA family protein [Mycobacteroides abscessus]RIT36780.1 ParA family protein [Mycobacteroides abscessus]